MEKQIVTAYLFKSGELEALLTDISIGRNALSPISMDVGNRPLLTEEKLKLRESVAFLTVASIILNPQIRISAIKGGGSLGMEHFDLLGRIDGSNAVWTAFLHNDNTTAILSFADTTGLVEWFGDTFNVKTDVSMNNFLASSMTLEEWIVLAHTVDAFRRVYMESMLLYKPKREYSIGAEDFIASLNVSLESGDIRWLLPAFFAVTPGLSGLKPNISPEVLQTAEAYGLISHTRNPDTNEGIFAFTTEGMTLGLEFATSWMYGVGFDAAVLNDDGGRCVPACFLAPTSLGNHLFTAEKTETGKWSINHQALTHTQLDKSLAEWVGKIIDHAVEVEKRVPAEAPKPVEAIIKEDASEIYAPVEQPKPMETSISLETIKPVESPAPIEKPAMVEQLIPVQQNKPIEPPKPAQAPAFHFCMKCGNKIMSGVRFCSKCGSKVA